MNQSSLYGCKRVDTSEFEVEFHVGDEDQALEEEISDNSDIQTAPIPIFYQVHTVQVDADYVMYCDCCHLR